ncbi:MAG: hypothetical protein AB1352_00435 [Patescibacteria group bacterium]
MEGKYEGYPNYREGYDDQINEERLKKLLETDGAKKTVFTEKELRYLSLYDLHLLNGYYIAQSEENAAENLAEVRRELTFRRKKQAYFTKIGIEVRYALKFHKPSKDQRTLLSRVSLWEKRDRRPEEKDYPDDPRRLIRDWGNVSEHCLVEVARVEVLAEMLGLSDEVKRKLIIAAALHDSGKRNEVTAMKKAKARCEDVMYASEQADSRWEAMLIRHNVPEDIVHLAGSCGGHPHQLKETMEVLDKFEHNKKLTEHDLAFLIMHYVDDFTDGNKWVTESEWVMESEGEGNLINDVDRRMRANAKKELYKAPERDARIQATRPEFKEMNVWQAMAYVSHRIEETLTFLIQEPGREIEPLKIPEEVDKLIREKIDRVQLDQ